MTCEGKVNDFRLRANTGKPSRLPMKDNPRACLVNLCLFASFVMFRFVVLSFAGSQE
jgi:hypothetical protein